MKLDDASGNLTHLNHLLDYIHQANPIPFSEPRSFQAACFVRFVCDYQVEW